MRLTALSARDQNSSSVSEELRVPQDDDGLSQEQVDRALRETPGGAFALAGLTVGLLIVAWVAIYLLVFLPRGPVS